MNFRENFFFLNHAQAIDYFYELFCNILLRVSWEHCCQRIVFCPYILDTLFQYYMNIEKCIDICKILIRIDTYRYFWHHRTLNSIQNAFKSKHSDTLSTKLYLLHNNNKHHTTYLIMLLLKDFKWKVFEYSLYFADLVRSDYHLFPRLKKEFKCQRFATQEELVAAVECIPILKNLDNCFYHDGIEKLVSRLNKMFTKSWELLGEVVCFVLFLIIFFWNLLYPFWIFQQLSDKTSWLPLVFTVFIVKCIPARRTLYEKGVHRVFSCGTADLLQRCVLRWRL